MNRPLRVLCLDIEGGYGGSSRSLYEVLRHMDRAQVHAEVWCKRDGPVRARYEAAGIPCRIEPGLPAMNSLERFSRNVYGYSRWLKEFLAWPGRAQLAAAANERADVVHFNHEGLFGLAAWLRRRHGNAQCMHVRTMLLDNLFARSQARLMAATNDRVVFITENERDRFQKLARQQPAGAVIYNAASPPAAGLAAHPSIPRDGRLKLAMLANFALMRGVDRVVELAEALAARGRRDILFVVAGDMRLPRGLDGALGEVARAGGTLADHAAARGVADMILFLGHVAEPESVLAGCDLLIKPTRFNNPWGRDILEAMAFEKPVIAVGEYDRFVESDVTGFLMKDYDTEAMTDIIQRLDRDRELCRTLGRNAARRAAELCDGPSRASDLLRLWQDAAAARQAA